MILTSRTPAGQHYLFPVPHVGVRFSVRRAEREIVCTVHETRPELCRQYSCFGLLILDQHGRRAGRIMQGTRYFTAVDPRIHALWQKEYAGLVWADELLGEDQVDHILSREGYRVIR